MRLRVNHEARKTKILKTKKQFKMNNTNNLSARASFDQARIMFAKAMADKFPTWAQAIAWANSLKLSQNEVRCEVKLLTTSTNFIFGVTTQDQNSDNVIYNTENRLKSQDSLCVNEYGIFIRKVGATATSTIDRINTYANANIYSTSNVATAMEGTFYSHGSFGCKVNGDVIIPYRGLWNHLYVPQTQQTGVTASSTVANFEDQVRGAEDGFITAEPNIVLVGTKSYVPEIKLPAALAAVETGTRAVLIMRGILAQNSTSFT